MEISADVNVGGQLQYVYDYTSYYSNTGGAFDDTSAANAAADQSQITSLVATLGGSYYINEAAGVGDNNFWNYYNNTFGANYIWDDVAAPATSANGFTVTTFAPVDTTTGLTSYVGNAGMYSFNTGANSGYSNGPFFTDSTTKLTDISSQDGTANTIAFGEALGGPEVGPRLKALTWMGMGCMPSYWDLQTPSYYFTFGSGHMVVNFAFCDGSVRGITKVAASPGDTVTAAP